MKQYPFHFSMHFQTLVCFILFSLLALTRVSLQSVPTATSNPYGTQPEKPCDKPEHKALANVPAYVPPVTNSRAPEPQEDEEECEPEEYVNPYTTPVARSLTEPVEAKSLAKPAVTTTTPLITANPTAGGYGKPEKPCNCEKPEPPLVKPTGPGYIKPKAAANPYLGTTSVDGKGSDDDEDASEADAGSHGKESKLTSNSDSDSEESKAFKLTSSTFVILALWFIAAFGWA